jgi:hypothetical protein
MEQSCLIVCISSRCHIPASVSFFPKVIIFVQIIDVVSLLPYKPISVSLASGRQVEIPVFFLREKNEMPVASKHDQVCSC